MGRQTDVEVQIVIKIFLLLGGDLNWELIKLNLLLREQPCNTEKD